MLAGSTPGPGRASESLSDIEPAIGNRTGGLDRRVRAMPALNDQQAEVERRTGDAIDGIGRTPRPHLVVRPGQLDPDRLGRSIKAIGQVAERQRPDADVSY